MQGHNFPVHWTHLQRQPQKHLVVACQSASLLKRLAAIAARRRLLTAARSKVDLRDQAGSRGSVRTQQANS